MTHAARSVKTLIQDMAEDRLRYHDLTTLLEKQRHHIVTRNADALDALNAHIMAHYQHLLQSSQRRYQLLGQIGLDGNSDGMKTLIARLPEAHRPSVSALWGTLREQAAACQAANDYNGTLLNMQQEILSGLLNADQPENWLYQQG